MFCPRCGKDISHDSKFCQFCGSELSNVDFNIDESQLESCQLCGAKSPVKYNEFYANIGMLVSRQQLSLKGKMCKHCINKYFWKYTLINLFLGWWGCISFFATSLFMINNIFRYIGSITLKKYY
jgi:hypothetical protein